MYELKYGVLGYKKTGMVNIGDTIQSIALKRVYRKLGISNDSLLTIDKEHLSKYDGIPVVLPLSANCDHYTGNEMFPIPDEILPVFFGFRCVDDALLVHLDKYKSLSSFGCRDSYNTRLLRRCGFHAYTSGCMSLQVGEYRRHTIGKKRKIFFVDISRDHMVLDFFPDYLMPNAVFLPQSYYLYDKNMFSENGLENLDLAMNCLKNDTALKDLSDEEYLPQSALQYRHVTNNGYVYYDCNIEDSMSFIENLAEYRLNLLYEEASLVVTCRFHTALPCVAMGIPVILIKSNEGKNSDIDNRFSGYSQLIHYYDSTQYSQIDWNPVANNCQELQEYQFMTFKRELDSVLERYESQTCLSTFFDFSDPVQMSSIGMSYLSDYEKRAWMKKTTEKSLFELIIKKPIHNCDLYLYGAGDKGSHAYRRLKKYFALFKSIKYIDSASDKQGHTLNSVDIIDPSVLDRCQKDNTVVIVTLNGADALPSIQIKRKLIRDYKYQEGIDFYMLDKLLESLKIQIDPSDSVGWMEKKLWNE